jgi:hypothetical protein
MLVDQHGEELTPAVVGTEFLSQEMQLSQRIKFISRDKCKHLLEDGVAIGHGSDLIGLYDLFAKSLYQQAAFRTLSSLIFLRQQ